MYKRRCTIFCHFSFRGFSFHSDSLLTNFSMPSRFPSTQPLPSASSGRVFSTVMMPNAQPVERISSRCVRRRADRVHTPVSKRHPGLRCASARRLNDAMMLAFREYHIHLPRESCVCLELRGLKGRASAIGDKTRVRTSGQCERASGPSARGIALAQRRDCPYNEAEAA
jgi:hypothetical protein